MDCAVKDLIGTLTEDEIAALFVEQMEPLLETAFQQGFPREALAKGLEMSAVGLRAKASGAGAN